jgi:hypothetical protein
MRNLKGLRAVCTVGVLVGGLVFLGWTKTTGVNATDCATAFQNFMNADNTYEIARYSYFYDDPTSCIQECQNSTNPHCVEDCQIRRHTALGNAELGMSTSAEDTCTPYTVDACAQARAMADGCLNQLNSSSYSSQEELDSLFSQYAACLTASKVDACQ